MIACNSSSETALKPPRSRTSRAVCSSTKCMNVPISGGVKPAGSYGRAFRPYWQKYANLQEANLSILDALSFSRLPYSARTASGDSRPRLIFAAAVSLPKRSGCFRRKYSAAERSRAVPPLTACAASVSAGASADMRSSDISACRGCRPNIAAARLYTKAGRCGAPSEFTSGQHSVRLSDGRLRQLYISENSRHSSPSPAPPRSMSSSSRRLRSSLTPRTMRCFIFLRRIRSKSPADTLSSDTGITPTS